eukprot:PhF_6_TR23214/c0_g1_i1/m.32539
MGSCVSTTTEKHPNNTSHPISFPFPRKGNPSESSINTCHPVVACDHCVSYEETIQSLTDQVASLRSKEAEQQTKIDNFKFLLNEVIPHYNIIDADGMFVEASLSFLGYVPCSMDLTTFSPSL